MLDDRQKQTGGEPFKGALHQAAAAGHVDVVRMLLSAGASATDHDDRMTPLQAVCHGDLSRSLTADRKVCIDTLIEAGADIDEEYDDGRTLLHAAATWSPGIVRILLDRGADPTAKCMGLTPAETALAAGADACIAVFAEHFRAVAKRNKTSRW